MDRKNSLPKDIRKFVNKFNEARSKRICISTPFNPPLPEFTVKLEMVLSDTIHVVHQDVFIVNYKREEMIRIERAKLLDTEIDEEGRGGNLPSSTCHLTFQGDVRLSLYIYDEE